MSHLERLSGGDRRRIAALIELELLHREREHVVLDWSALARPDQLPPAGDWRTWLILAGRAWGKTRCAAETMADWARTGQARQIAIVARTSGELRNVAIPALRAAAGPDVHYSSSNHHQLRWPNGAAAYGFSAERPVSFRGYNLDAAWVDELAAFKKPEEVFDQLQLALRARGARAIITTTPRPMALLRELVDDPSTVVTRGRTSDNAENLDQATLEYYLRYADTRLGRQELEGELLDDPSGGLWDSAWIEGHRVSEVPALVRIVVAIDPALGGSRGSDETGIIVAGKDAGGDGYVLADLSGRMSPDRWARVAVGAYRQYGADEIVAEENVGGSLVQMAIQSVDPTVSYRGVRASQSKLFRAAPIASLYQQGRVHHVGTWLELEDQLCTARLDPGSGHNDRLDALVWAFINLVLAGSPLDVPGAIRYASGIWKCLQCEHLYTWDPGRRCPRCGLRAPMTDKDPVPGSDD